ncbi:hypothetical protein C9374_006395 [Naegleria lovaniensis]|uniref:Uncharacterized protein n=1 Tax=Naegleria lovaniensis TaxID=51637 RepID=A0AA88GI59_NAELO|nr:uncharacterized protein C9374_006395 [Naegleria lovaniensis]KAG2381406.1 hypothetical protein C9374_006395 [Naegleria lovaniensis]
MRLSVLSCSSSSLVPRLILLSSLFVVVHIFHHLLHTLHHDDGHYSSFTHVQGAMTVQLQSNTNNYTIPKSFANAIDAAMQQLTTDSEFIQGMTDLGILFPTPNCVVLPGTSTNQVPKFPSTLVLPRGSSTSAPPFTSLILCYEENAVLNWPKVHELAGRILMRILNQQYKVTIPYSFAKVNTTQYGYFGTLKNLVDTGACDVAIASTNLDSVRLPQVHFNCPYGSSSSGFLRSALEPNVSIGTSQHNYAIANFPLAQITAVPTGLTDCFPYILQNKVHVMLADAIDLQTWLNSHKSECSSCVAKAFGDPFTYGSFITNNIANSGIRNSINYIMMVLVVGILMFQLWM